MRKFTINKVRNIAFYPHLLFEGEITLEDNEKVYACISVLPNRTDTHKEIWLYGYDINTCMKITDDLSMVAVFPEEREEIMEAMYNLWNENPTVREEWESVK